MRGQVAFGIVAFVSVLSAPLIATGGQLVGCQCAGAWGEAGGGEDRLSAQATNSGPNLNTYPMISPLKEAHTHLQVMIIVFSPSQDGLSAMILA